jgi:hypothetical protein
VELFYGVLKLACRKIASISTSPNFTTSHATLLGKKEQLCMEREKKQPTLLEILTPNEEALFFVFLN